MGELRLVPRKSRATYPTYFMFSDTGYLSDSHWIPIMHKLADRMEERHIGVAWSLIVDNLGVHKTLETLEVCALRNMKVAFFAPNTTHVLQPCDDKIFAIFKNALTREFFDSYRSGYSKERDAGRLLVPISQRGAQHINSDVVRSSFRDTGINPFDPDQKTRETSSGDKN